MESVHFLGEEVEKYASPSVDGAERHAIEERIYLRLGRHPRILSYLGKDPSTGALRFPYLRNGTVGYYLRNNPIPPLELRLRWISQLAEGLSYLHSHSIVWVDCHLDNLLLTDNFDVVLSDFAGSRIDCEFQSVQPPPYYVLPSMLDLNSVELATVQQDIFGFATCMFIVLGLKLPHRSRSYAADANMSFDDILRIAESHKAGKFDALSNETFPGLAEVVQKCWKAHYSSMDPVLIEVRKGCQDCLHKFQSIGQTKNPATVSNQPIDLQRTCLKLPLWVLLAAVVGCLASYQVYTWLGFSIREL